MVIDTSRASGDQGLEIEMHTETGSGAEFWKSLEDARRSSRDQDNESRIADAEIRKQRMRNAIVSLDEASGVVTLSWVSDGEEKSRSFYVSGWGYDLGKVGFVYECGRNGRDDFQINRDLHTMGAMLRCSTAELRGVIRSALHPGIFH